MDKLKSTPVLFSVAGVLAVIVGIVYLRPWDVEYSNEQLVEIALTHENSQRRATAASQLAGRGEESREPLRRLLNESQDPAVVAISIHALGQMWDHQSMPQMIDAMDHESLAVRGRAINAVERMVGAQINLKADDSEDKRKAQVAHLRKNWQVRSQQPSVISRLEELANQGKGS